MTPEQQQQIRAAQVEEAFWRFYVAHKNELADVEANTQLLLQVLEENLAPVSLHNLEVVWAGLSPERKAQFAAPTGGVRYKPQVKAVETILEKEDVGTPAARERMRNVLPDGRPQFAKSGGVLPAKWTKAKLIASDRETYKALLAEYGADAVNRRLAEEAAKENENV